LNTASFLFFGENRGIDGILCDEQTNGKEGLHASMFQMTGTLIRGDFNAAPLLTCLSSIAGVLPS